MVGAALRAALRGARHAAAITPLTLIGAYNRRALRWTWGLVAAWLLVVATAAPALAAPDVATRAAADGTTVVVGNGWRPGQKLAVIVGGDLFTAQADQTGEFEITTPLPFNPLATPQLAVRALPDTFSIAPPTAAPPKPHPLAVLFARSLATSAAWLSIAAAALVAGLVSRRVLLIRHDAR